MTTVRSFLRPVWIATATAACLLAPDVILVFAQPKDNPSVYAALTNVPQKARGKRNPLANDPDASTAGRKLFEQHCAECHGTNAEGTKRGPSLLDGPVERATPGEIFWIVTNGVVRRGMPPWSKLPESQRWQIITFLRESR